MQPATKPDWLFEPCDPEGAKNMNNIDYTHATRGARPIAPQKPPARVMGYGFNQTEADHDAERKAKVYDAYEQIGKASQVINDNRSNPVARPTMPTQINCGDTIEQCTGKITYTGILPTPIDWNGSGSWQELRKKMGLE